MSSRRTLVSSPMHPHNINSWIRVWFLCAIVVVWYKSLWMSPSHTTLNTNFIFLNENLRKDSGTRYVILYDTCIRNLYFIWSTYFPQEFFSCVESISLMYICTILIKKKRGNILLIFSGLYKSLGREIWVINRVPLYVEISLTC